MPSKRVFTIEHINDLHDRLGSNQTLSAYLRALQAIGVQTSDSFLADGHSEFFGTDGYKVVSPPAHETLTIADTSSREGLLEHLKQHSQGSTSYLEMSRGLAESGVAKWTFDMNTMTLAYYDKAGNTLLVEDIR